MSGILLNIFTSPDPAFASAVECFAASMRGHLALSLTHWDDTTVPAIAAGSVAECDGDLYEFEAEEAISTTDPITASTVADGIVYIMLIPSGGSITAAFTATPPVWGALLYGWYCPESGFENCRYVAGCMKATAAFSGKGYFDDFTQVGHIEKAFSSTVRFPYLLSYGQEISRTAFAVLFDSIGTVGGVGDGTTTFNTPDLRGRKIIGLDNTGGVSANRVTSAQADILGGVDGNENGTLEFNFENIYPYEPRYYIQPIMNPYMACNKAVKFI